MFTSSAYMDRSFCFPVFRTSSTFLVFCIATFVPSSLLSNVKNNLSSRFNNPLMQSSCFKRIPIPHFRVKDYSLPGSAFLDRKKCPHEPIQHMFRTSLSEDDFRLSKTVLPIHYLVKICPDVRSPFMFNGSVEIEVEVNEATQEITLNVLDLYIKSVSVWFHRSKLQEDVEALNRFIPSINDHFSRRKNSKFKNFRKHKNRINDTSNIKDSPLSYLYRDKKYVLPFLKENVSKTKYLTVTFLNIDPVLQRMTIHTKEKLDPNVVYKLKIVFTGFANHALMGLYTTSHYDNKHNERQSLVTQFQVSDARRVFPCFDEPSFKTPFTITLCREERLRTVSNMPKIATFSKKDDPGIVWDTFRTSVPMATYLVAFAVLDDYNFLDCNHSFIPFKVWAPTNKIHLTKFACEVAPPLLDFFENYFRIPYPLPKMDLLGVRDFFALGMENWGLVTFIWDRLLIDYASPTTVKLQQEALETISHEMAHQWFGNLVTPSWWSDIWLNEGFATFLSIIGIDYIRPSWKKLEEYVVAALHPVLMMDGFESSHPIVVNVSDPIDFFSIFDEISYAKGCFIVRMMMHILTEKVFQEGLRTYLNKMAYKSATQEDLWHILTNAGHQADTFWKNLSISEIMNTWILQEGYPLVNVTRLKTGDLAVTQERYYQELDEKEAMMKENIATGSDGPKWWIPLSVVTQQNPNMSDTLPKFWMNLHTHIFYFDSPPSPEDWFLLNIRQTGFFRVNYDRENWLLLIRQLKDDHHAFDEITRAQLMDDSFVLAYSGLVNFDIPLEMILYLDKEESPYVITAALNNFGPLSELYTHDALYGNFKHLLVSLFSSHYPSTGIVNRSFNLPFVRETQNLLIKTFCKMYEPCIEESKKVFVEWAKNPQNNSIVDEDILPTILCVAVAEGGETEWEIAFNIILNPSFAEMGNLVSILACSRHLWLNSRLLMLLSMDESSVHSEVYLLIALKNIARNPSTFPIAWQYLLDVWPRIVSNMEEDIYFEAVAPYVWTRAQFQQVVSFVETLEFKSNRSMPEAYVQEILRNVERKYQFQKRCYEAIRRWFFR